MPDDSVYDCIIIGGGPAGLTCAIFMGRYRRRVLVVDNEKPRNYASRGIHGFVGQHGIDPLELRRRGRAEAEASGVEFCDCTALSAEQVGDFFELTTTSGLMRTRRLVLAYGIKDTLPEIPDLASYYGISIFHCADCDGYEVSDKRVGVIGWEEKVAGLALRLTQWTEDLTIFAHGHERDFAEEVGAKVRAAGIGIKDEKIISLVGTEGQLKAIVLSAGEHVPVDALFFTIGIEHSSDLGKTLGCVPAEGTHCFSVDPYRQTTIEGVYAIGDLVPGSQLAVTAAADGAIAAIAINKSLLPPGRLID